MSSPWRMAWFGHAGSQTSQLMQTEWMIRAMASNQSGPAEPSRFRAHRVRDYCTSSNRKPPPAASTTAFTRSASSDLPMNSTCEPFSAVGTAPSKASTMKSAMVLLSGEPNPRRLHLVTVRWMAGWTTSIWRLYGLDSSVFGRLSGVLLLDGRKYGMVRSVTTSWYSGLAATLPRYCFQALLSSVVGTATTAGAAASVFSASFLPQAETATASRTDRAMSLRDIVNLVMGVLLTASTWPPTPTARCRGRTRRRRRP